MTAFKINPVKPYSPTKLPMQVPSSDTGLNFSVRMERGVTLYLITGKNLYII